MVKIHQHGYDDDDYNDYDDVDFVDDDDDLGYSKFMLIMRLYITPICISDRYNEGCPKHVVAHKT